MQRIGELSMRFKLNGKKITDPLILISPEGEIKGQGRAQLAY